MITNKIESRKKVADFKAAMFLYEFEVVQGSYNYEAKRVCGDRTILVTYCPKLEAGIPFVVTVSNGDGTTVIDRKAAQSLNECISLVEKEITQYCRNDSNYIKLLLAFPPRPITSAEQFASTQRVIDSLIDNAPLSEDESDYLNLLGSLVYMYEQSEQDVEEEFDVTLLLEEQLAELSQRVSRLEQLDGIGEEEWIRLIQGIV